MENCRIWKKRVRVEFSFFMLVILKFEFNEDLSSHITACWLDSIANATVSVFCEEILKIPHLSTNSSKQLVIDIGESNFSF